LDPTPIQGLELSGLAAPRQLRTETDGHSQVSGESFCAFALLSRPRQDRCVRPYDAATRPPLQRRRGLPRWDGFRGSITRLQHSLSTLRPTALTVGRKTRFRCRPTLRSGTSTRRTPTKGFLDDSYIASPLYDHFSHLQ